VASIISTGRLLWRIISTEILFMVPDAPWRRGKLVIIAFILRKTTVLAAEKKMALLPLPIRVKLIRSGH
jgi:hypothetical protein